MYITGILFYLIGIIVALQLSPKYNLDIIDIDWNITTTHNCDMFWKLSQPSRGILALSGFLDFKEDLDTDKAKGWIDVYYSKNAITYMLTPFRVPPHTFTDNVNFLHKNYLMDSMGECCENAIYFEGTFVAPLTKRRMICENCILKSDNLPTHLRPGYYRIVGVCAEEIAFVVVITIRLEWD